MGWDGMAWMGGGAAAAWHLVAVCLQPVETMRLGKCLGLRLRLSWGEQT